jgi:predicted nucleotidyltransferase
MKEYQDLLNRFIQNNLTLLGNYLVGIYLHGSAAMGCFNPNKSDLDFLIVVSNELTNEIKRKYMDMLLEFNKGTPVKGIELHIVKENVCNPFVYPTPFEFHFSIAQKEFYQSNPDEYINLMKEIDKDLAAHFTIVRHRGKVLYGKKIEEVFGLVSKENYFDSIWHDIAGARADIIKDTLYVTLNLCRSLAFVKDDLVLSKLEGGNWCFRNIPAKYRCIVSAAVEEYKNDKVTPINKTLAHKFADYMLAQIKTEAEERKLIRTCKTLVPRRDPSLIIS